jgi:hypothetical protein
MFSNLFKKKRERVYIDSLVVAPRDEISKIDEWGIFESIDLEGSARERLVEIFQLHHISERIGVEKNDLALDVVVINLQGGEFGGVHATGFFLPLFWRPKVQIRSRLYFIESNKNKASFSVNVKMPWKEYVSRLFTFNGLIRYKPLFDFNDIDTLLTKGSLELMKKMLKLLA